MPPIDSFIGLFELRAHLPGKPQRDVAPRTLPDPATGHPLRVASVDVAERSVCPACTQLGTGAYVSFVSDLRLAFACPSCRQVVWIAGT